MSQKIWRSILAQQCRLRLLYSSPLCEVNTFFSLMHVLTDIKFAGILEGYKQCIQYCNINIRLGELLSKLYRTVSVNSFLCWTFCVVSVKSTCDESQQFKKQCMKWHSNRKHSKVDIYPLANISVFNQI